MIPFYYLIIFHCVDIPNFIYPFISWTFRLRSLFGYMNNTAMNTLTILNGCTFSFLPGMYLGVELLDYMINLGLTFLGISKLFSKKALAIS